MYQTKTLSSFSECTKKCCDPDVTYPQNWDGIDECQDYLDGWWKMILMISVPIIGGVCLSIGILLCCLFCEKPSCLSRQQTQAPEIDLFKNRIKPEETPSELGNYVDSQIIFSQIWLLCSKRKNGSI